MNKIVRVGAIPDLKSATANPGYALAFDLDNTLIFPGFMTEDSFAWNNIHEQRYVPGLLLENLTQATWNAWLRKHHPLHSFVGKPSAQYVITFRPDHFIGPTLKQLRREKVAEHIQAVYFRNSDVYPVYDDDAVFEYKLLALIDLFQLYNQVVYIDDKLDTLERLAVTPLAQLGVLILFHAEMQAGEVSLKRVVEAV